MGPGQRMERAVRSDLQQNVVGLGEQRFQTGRKLNRLAEVPCPIRRIRGLLRRDPGARAIGDVGDLGRIQANLLHFLTKRLHRRLHHRRMKSVRRAQTVRRKVPLAKLRFQLLDRVDRPRHHAKPRTVDCRDGAPSIEKSRHVARCRRHRDHEPAGQVAHQAAARGHQRQPVLNREHACQAGRHVFANAVADHGRRPNPPRHPQLCQGIFDGEQRRLRELRLGKTTGGLLLIPLARIQQLAQIAVDMSREDLAAPVQLLAEDGFRLVEFGSHARILGPLAREHERHGPVRRVAKGVETLPGLGRGPSHFPCGRIGTVPDLFLGSP